MTHLQFSTWASCTLMAVGASVVSTATGAQQLSDTTLVPTAGVTYTRSDDILWLERTRDFTHDFSYSVAKTVDGWFGNDPFAESGGKVSGHVRLNTLWDQDDGLDGNVRFRLRADLPNLRRQAYAFVGQDNEREEVTDQPENFSRQQLLLRESRRDDQSFFAGLGVDLKKNVDFRVGVRGGLNFYVQARYRDHWLLSDRDRLDFRQTLFWTVDDSIGATTVLDYERAFSPSLALRWSTTGTITRRSHGFEWYSGIGPFKTLNEKQLVALEAIVQGKTGAVDISNYGMRGTFRQTLYKDWLTGTVTVGHFWPKNDDDPLRRKAWAVGMGVEMQF